MCSWVCPAGQRPSLLIFSLASVEEDQLRKQTAGLIDRLAQADLSDTCRTGRDRGQRRAALGRRNLRIRAPHAVSQRRRNKSRSAAGRTLSQHFTELASTPRSTRRNRKGRRNSARSLSTCCLTPRQHDALMHDARADAWTVTTRRSAGGEGRVRPQRTVASRD